MSDQLSEDMIARMGAILTYQNAQAYARDNPSHRANDPGAVRAMRKGFREDLLLAIRFTNLPQNAGPRASETRQNLLAGFITATQKVISSGGIPSLTALQLLEQLLNTGTCDVLQSVYDEAMRLMKAQTKRRKAPSSRESTKAEDPSKFGPEGSRNSAPGGSSHGLGANDASPTAPSAQESNASHAPEGFYDRTIGDGPSGTATKGSSAYPATKDSLATSDQARQEELEQLEKLMAETFKGRF